MSFLIELEKSFKATANPIIASSQSKYMRGLFPFFGIPKPQRSEIEKALLQKYPIKNTQELSLVLLELWKKTEREFHYTALSIAQKHKKFYIPDLFSIFTKMIQTHSWWDSIDTIGPHLLGSFLPIYPQYLPYMDEWIAQEGLWLKRASLLHQLRWKEKTDQEKLFSYCRICSGDKRFFIRKAIGWVLREYSKTNQEAVKKFLASYGHELSALSHKEARKYLELS